MGRVAGKRTAGKAEIMEEYETPPMTTVKWSDLDNITDESLLAQGARGKFAVHFTNKAKNLFTDKKLKVPELALKDYAEFFEQTTSSQNTLSAQMKRDLGIKIFLPLIKKQEKNNE